ncbi:MAG: protein kinase [Polyangiaceae bacterium]
MTTGAPGDPLSLVGKTLAGHFLVQTLTAEGHTSIVYRGEHVGPKRPVALKCLKITVDLDAARADTFLKRLREETRVYSQASRNEPHFVRSIGTGMTVTGSGNHVPYSVLEWLDGRSLAADSKARKESGTKPRTLAETAELLAPTARALASVHASNLAHGDIGSRNIILLKNPMSGFDTKLLDFGVSKVIRDVSRELAHDRAPAPENDPFWIPSPGYAAPEQLRRELGDIGPWSDVYSFAVVFLETMCDRPLGTPTPQLSQMGLTLPETVEKVLARALMESPKDRWPRGGEFWAALEDSLRTSAIQIPSRPPPVMAPGAQTLRLGGPVAPAAPAAIPAGKKTVRMGGAASPAVPRAAPKPQLLPAAATRVPPAAGAKPPPPLATPVLDNQKPIQGTPVLFAKPLTVPPPKASPAPGPVKTAPIAPDPVVAAAPPPPPATPQVAAPIAGAVPPPPPSAPISSQPISSGQIVSAPISSGPSSVPPPPPAKGAVLAVAPGPLPLPPPPSTSGSPQSETKRSVSAAPPAARAQVSMESLPSVIVADAEIPGSPKRGPASAETVRLLNPPSPAGLPPSSLVAHPGVIVMPANMTNQGAPSNRRLSYDERRERERKRLFVVMFVSFAVVFLVGAGFLALHFLRGRSATSMAAHSESN